MREAVSRVCLRCKWRSYRISLQEPAARTVRYIYVLFNTRTTKPKVKLQHALTHTVQTVSRKQVFKNNKDIKRDS